MQGRSRDRRDLLEVESVAGHLLPAGTTATTRRRPVCEREPEWHVVARHGRAGPAA